MSRVIPILIYLPHTHTMTLQPAQIGHVPHQYAESAASGLRKQQLRPQQAGQRTHSSIVSPCRADGADTDPTVSCNPPAPRAHLQRSSASVDQTDQQDERRCVLRCAHVQKVE